ncbi:MAG: hypothetical protein HQ577_04200 [Dehalococcoidia bacterium]|jgi:hypothetical protein|nr:hypothetical protein [Dehalococcoidia bacterium]
MVLNSLIFAFIAYGIMMVIALFVAAIIKGIALVVQRGGKPAAADKQKGSSG